MAKVLTAATRILAVVLLLYAPQIASADGPGDWPMIGHDTTQTGYGRTGSGPVRPSYVRGK
ncbi:MAG: hypothetical protein Q7R39_11580 [Dehalococcoidia bacterium]|nr:hypothetical protein [Dehalococcoidia bacterium]